MPASAAAITRPIVAAVLDRPFVLAPDVLGGGISWQEPDCTLWPAGQSEQVSPTKPFLQEPQWPFV